MKELRRILLVMLVAAAVACGTFAQKNSNDNRPPKENPKVIEKEKEKPPPSNSNSNRKKP